MQYVDLIFERIKFLACHHQFVLRQFKLCCSLSGDPIPLTAFLAAELLATAGSVLSGQGMSTPSTTAFCSPHYSIIR
jgi:hypothetical protein